MFFNKFAICGSTLSLLVTLSLGAVCAQQTASSNLSGEINDAEPVQKSNEKSSDHGFSTSDFLPPDRKGTIKPEADTKVPVKVVINVPHNIEAINEFTVYPYPMQPPRQKQQVKGLPETEKNGLRNMLITSGYTQRTQTSRAYPYGGWRWQYAYKAALRRSGLGSPHVVSEMYTWADEMMPYIKPECIRLNLAEKERTRLYQRAKEDYDETRVDSETESVRKGLFPVDVRIQKFDGRQTRFGTMKLLPGSWWLVGTHKVSGLTYYWNLPIVIDADEPPKTIELTEANAMVIEGAW